jgi:hypothetical protein
MPDERPNRLTCIRLINDCPHCGILFMAPQEELALLYILAIPKLVLIDEREFSARKIYSH